MVLARAAIGDVRARLHWRRLRWQRSIVLTRFLPVTQPRSCSVREPSWSPTRVYAELTLRSPFFRNHSSSRCDLLLHSFRAPAHQNAVLAHAWVNYETLLENCLVGFLVRD